MATTLLLDGYNLAYRAYHGMPELTRADGFPTGAIHGWVRTLWYLSDHYAGSRSLVFFDLGGAARQEALRDDYKATRAEMPADMRQQMPPMKRISEAMGYGATEADGVEADDLIASCARQISELGTKAIIVSADKDLGQCLQFPGVRQLLPPPTANPKLGWRELDAQGVEEKFGVPPVLIPDLLALVGDTSDNIPGLPGVGPKTAAKWLRQYGNLQGVLDHSGELKPARFQAAVHAAREDLLRNLEMTALDFAHPIAVPEGLKPDPAALVALFEELEMARSAADARKRFGVEG